MILSKLEIKDAMDKGEIKFSPEIESTQLGDASVDLRLGLISPNLKNPT